MIHAVKSVGVLGLSPPEAKLPLFEGEQHSRLLWAAIDKINARYKVDKVYKATMHGQRNSVPRHIQFWKSSDLKMA